MCNFFSCVSDGHGSIYYFGAKERLELEESNSKKYEFDSHSSIGNYYKLREDNCNKYEYNPFTKEFVIDQLNNKNDSAHVEKQLREMDFNPIFETGLFDIDLSSFYKLPEGFKFPKKCHDINLTSLIELPEGFNFPKECNIIYLNSLESLPKSIKFPEKCNIFDLYSVESLENINFIDEYKSIDLECCKSIKNVIFPKKMKGYLDLCSVELLDGVTLPEECEILYLNSLKSLKDIILPKEYTIIYLSSINSNDYKLPKKHGEIMFKDKTIESNM